MTRLYDKIMKLSRFCYFFEYNDNKYIVNTLNRKIFLVTVELFDCLKEGLLDFFSSNDQSLLIEHNFIVEDSSDEISGLLEVYKESDNDKEWNSLHIIPTTKCNLACEYCFVLKGKESRVQSKDLSILELHQGIDLFFTNNESKEKIVTFYGGEPLIKFDILNATVTYIREKYHNEKVSYKIITNGTLVTDRISEFLSKNNFDVNVSLDGWKESHDVFRIYNNSDSSFDDTIDGIKRLQKHGNSIKILITVGDFNLAHIEENVSKILDLRPTSIALNLPKQLDMADNGIEKNIDFKELMTKFFQCIEMCYDQKIPEAHFADVIFGFLREEVQYRPCHGCGKQIVIAPGRKVGPCQAFVVSGKYFVDFRDDMSLESLRTESYFEKWKNIVMMENRQCAECYLLPVCPGDCPFDWENRTGTFDIVPESYCYTRKAMFDYLLSRIIDKKQVLFKSGNSCT